MQTGDTAAVLIDREHELRCQLLAALINEIHFANQTFMWKFPD
jgi:hypothetical protein